MISLSKTEYMCMNGSGNGKILLTEGRAEEGEQVQVPQYNYGKQWRVQ